MKNRKKPNNDYESFNIVCLQSGDSYPIGKSEFLTACVDGDDRIRQKQDPGHLQTHRLAAIREDFGARYLLEFSDVQDSVDAVTAWRDVALRRADAALLFFNVHSEESLRDGGLADAHRQLVRVKDDERVPVVVVACAHFPVAAARPFCAQEHRLRALVQGEFAQRVPLVLMDARRSLCLQARHAVHTLLLEAGRSGIDVSPWAHFASATQHDRMQFAPHVRRSLACLVAVLRRFQVPRNVQIMVCHFATLTGDSWMPQSDNDSDKRCVCF